MHLIEDELQRVMLEWNSHRIRPTRNTDCRKIEFLPMIEFVYIIIQAIPNISGMKYKSLGCPGGRLLVSSGCT